MTPPMTPERLAEIRHAAQIRGALDIGEHRVELLAEVDRLAVELSVATQAAGHFKWIMRQREAERDALRERESTVVALADGAIDYAEREVSDYDRVVAERDAARAELAGRDMEVADLRARYEGAHTQHQRVCAELAGLRRLVLTIADEAEADIGPGDNPAALMPYERELRQQIRETARQLRSAATTAPGVCVGPCDLTPPHPMHLHDDPPPASPDAVTEEVAGDGH